MSVRLRRDERGLEPAGWPPAPVAGLYLHHSPRRGIARSVFILVLLGGVCCTGEQASDPDAPTRDSAGVAIVDNPGQDRTRPGQPVLLADLATPDDALTPVPWGVAADEAAGRVYVADAAANRVAVFDAAGGFVGELGRAGEGPGEFERPSALAMLRGTVPPGGEPPGSGDVLVVLDPLRSVLSRWSGDGEFLREDRLPADYWGPGFQVGPDWFAAVTSSTTGMRVAQRLEVKSLRETAVVHEVAYEMAMMELPCATMPAPKIFAPDVVWTRAGDTFYYLNGPGYRVDAWSDGAVTRSFRRPLAPVAVSREMAVTWAGLGPGPYQGFMRGCNLSAEELVEAVGHEDVLPPVAGLAADPAGRLWVARRGTGLAPEEIDIFDPDGAYLGTLHTPAVPVAFLSESRFVGVRLDPSTGRVLASIYETGDAGTVEHDRGSSQAGGAAGTAPTGEAASEEERSAPPRDPVPNPAGLREFRDCPACPAMVELPPGRYMMGTSDEEEERSGLGRNPRRTRHSRNAERPQLDVTIDYRFALGKYETTFEEWDRCVDAGGCTYRPTDRGFGRGSRPVIHVSRLDAEEYLDWLRETTGQPYRLPSSAEWEYAARAGTATARWWGDELGGGRAVCDGCGSRWDDRSTTPVGSFPPNPWGLHDMLSNVSEVVADCWHDTYEGHPADGSPRLEAPPGWPGGECRRATWRGGGWPSFRWTVRAATRSGGNMTLEDRRDHPRAGGASGFRVARTLDKRP
ncbi:MAG: SUMF1/EgtB/PvdO family nonheme iron enzyme [Gemmatimonadota bacterium]|nr:SUMF1/EgtB/PvdO family nonheme iron enzyme [Gemmatimonadota bacterium]MDE2872175.1 SUMF1/EgtB/PvdO family nonheme iron enzyme [Gemmatimonadota bacterium]